MPEVDLWIASVVLAAGFVQGVLGFGFGLVVMAVLPASSDFVRRWSSLPCWRSS